MAWNGKIRATSFAVTTLVAFTGYLTLGVPLAMLAWLAGLARVAVVVEVFAALGTIYSLTISIGDHYLALPFLGVRRQQHDGAEPSGE